LGAAVFSQVRELTGVFEQERKTLQSQVAAAEARAEEAEAREKATSRRLENQGLEVQRLQAIVTDITLLQEAKQVHLQPWTVPYSTHNTTVPVQCSTVL